MVAPAAVAAANASGVTESKSPMTRSTGLIKRQRGVQTGVGGDHERVVGQQLGRRRAASDRRR